MFENRKEDLVLKLGSNSHTSSRRRISVKDNLGSAETEKFHNIEPESSSSQNTCFTE
jgi:hypothetical protein